MHRRTLLKTLGVSATLAATHRLESLAQAVSPSAPKFFFNQAGFQPGAEKQASVPYAASAGSGGSSFRVRSAADGKVVYEGSLAAPEKDAASGNLLQQARFTSLTRAGRYKLEAAGIASDPFDIGLDVYASALRLAMRGFYGQRCGCAVDLGEGYKHPACHIAGAYHPTSGKSGALANRGGWHDAGDYGRYVVNSGITMGTLLWAWELYPRVLQGLALAIPESGGKTPDYLAEIRWNLEWMLSLQDATGDATGEAGRGVWHKQTSEQFCAFIMPQDDHLTSYVIGTGAEPYKSTCATADLASVAAIAARCYKPYDAAFAERCLQAARRAWTWAMAHPGVTFSNPPGIGTGAYADRHCGDELLWASAELWRTTGEADYEEAFLEGAEPAMSNLVIAAPSWNGVAPMAFWTYTLAERPGSSVLRDHVRAATAQGASELVSRRRENGYGNTLASSDYIWGSNSVAANQSLLLLMADHFAPGKGLDEAAFGNLHYLLGRNCHGVCWLTHVGTRPFAHPHHRPSAADGIEAPWPGLLSGGPNAGGGDAIANAMPKMPPMRMWVDDQRAYSMNEIAINWNAPLVFLLAAVNARAL